MSTSRHIAWLPAECPVIGMVHARPLPGSPRFDGTFQAVVDAALADATALLDGGIAALLLENFGDAPFFPNRVPAVTIAHLTRLACEIRARFDVPLGVNVLRNDGLAAVAIAAASGAQFVRINVLTGARVSDQGLLEGQAHDVLRARQAARSEAIAIFADVDVKHSAPLAARSLEEEAVELVDRGGGDAVVVTGRATGHATDVAQVASLKNAVPGTPVIIGSGVGPANVKQYLSVADAVIAGTSLKENGDVRGAVSPQRVRELVAALTSS